ncbi:MAG: hypothetical protein D6734_02290, partial [Candidatus Schekmanbacteria bacterium]
MKKSLIYRFRSKIFFYIVLPLLLLMLAIGFVNVFGIPFTNIKGALQDRKEEIESKLSSIADLKREKITIWFNERIHNLDIVAKNQ